MMPQGLRSVKRGSSRKDRDIEPALDPHVIRNQAPTHKPAPSAASAATGSGSGSGSGTSTATASASSPAPSPKPQSPRPSAFAFARSSSSSGSSGSLAFWKRGTSSIPSPREKSVPQKSPPGGAREPTRKGTGKPSPRGPTTTRATGTECTPALSQSHRSESLPTRGVVAFPGRRGSRSLGGGVKAGGSRERGLARAGSRKAFSGPIRRAWLEAASGPEPADVPAAYPGFARGFPRGNNNAGNNSGGSNNAGNNRGGNSNVGNDTAGSNKVLHAKAGKARSEKERPVPGKKGLRKSQSSRAEGFPAAASVALRRATSGAARPQSQSQSPSQAQSHRGLLEAQAADRAQAAGAAEAGSKGAGAAMGRACFHEGQAHELSRRLSSDKWTSMGSLTEGDESADPDLLLDFESISVASGEAQDVAPGAPDGHYQVRYADCLLPALALNSPRGGEEQGGKDHMSPEVAFSAAVGEGVPALHGRTDDEGEAQAHAASTPPKSPRLLKLFSPTVGRSPLGSPGQLNSPGRAASPGGRGVMRSTSMAAPGGAVNSPNRTVGRYQRQRSELPATRNRLGSPAAAFPSAEELLSRAAESAAALRGCAGGNSAEEQSAAAQALRQMAKEGVAQVRAILGSGALDPLVEQLQSSHADTVEHCATALLNVSLHEKYKGELLKLPDFLDNIVFVLYSGSLRAKSSAAATLCCVSTLEGSREAIMGAGALAGLVSLVRHGDALGKRDAANCLLSLCMSRPLRLPIAQSEAVGALCEVIQEGSVDVDQQAASIFSALARIPEGREALLQQGALTPLAELLESGESGACREHALTALLGLAMNNRGCLWQIDELGISMALDVLSRSENVSLQAKAAGLREILLKFACEE